MSTEPTMVPLCKDCRHCIKRGDPDSWRCGATAYIDPVIGETKYRYSCSVERDARTSDSCGPDGKHFEPIIVEQVA